MGCQKLSCRDLFIHFFYYYYYFYFYFHNSEMLLNKSNKKELSYKSSCCLTSPQPLTSAQLPIQQLQLHPNNFNNCFILSYNFKFLIKSLQMICLFLFKNNKREKIILKDNQLVEMQLFIYQQLLVSVCMQSHADCTVSHRGFSLEKKQHLYHTLQQCNTINFMTAKSKLQGQVLAALHGQLGQTPARCSPHLQSQRAAQARGWPCMGCCHMFPVSKITSCNHLNHSSAGACLQSHFD